MSNVKIEFLKKSLEINHALRNSMDYKANFLLAISSAIFAFSLSNGFSVMNTLSALSAILCILAIGLPFRLVKKGSTGIMCWWGLRGKKITDYVKVLDELKTEDDLVEAYTKEIYTLYYRSIRYKAFLLKIASTVLLIGFIVYFIQIISF